MHRNAGTPIKKQGHPLIAFASLGLVLMLALAPVTADLWFLWVNRVTHSHGLLAAPLAVFLIAQRGLSWPVEGLRRHGIAGTIILTGLVLLLVGTHGDIRFFQHLSVPIFLIGMFVALFGTRAARQHAAGLALFFFMVPVGDSLMPLLQILTANSVAAFGVLPGLDYRVDGILIKTPTANFRIVPECAGLRFMQVGAMLALVVASLERARAARMMVYVAATAATAFVANIIRIVMTVSLTSQNGLATALAFDHAAYGWGVYLVTLVTGLGLWLRFGAPARPAPAS